MRVTKANLWSSTNLIKTTVDNDLAKKGAISIKQSSKRKTVSSDFYGSNIGGGYGTKMLLKVEEHYQ